MVREIIHVQVGQCGNQIGNAFWSTMGSEHKLEPNGKFKGKPEEGDNQARLDKIDVYYQEAGTMRFVPRACLVDLEPGIMDVIKASPMGALFKPDNMCFGASGAGNNWFVVTNVVLPVYTELIYVPQPLNVLCILRSHLLFLHNVKYSGPKGTTLREPN